MLYFDITLALAYVAYIKMEIRKRWDQMRRREVMRTSSTELIAERREHTGNRCGILIRHDFKGMSNLKSRGTMRLNLDEEAEGVARMNMVEEEK